MRGSIAIFLAAVLVTASVAPSAGASPRTKPDLPRITHGVVVGDAWSDYIPESSKLTADWTYPWVCGNCETPKFAAVAE